MAELYGKYDLQFGDFDSNPKTNQQHYYNKKYRPAVPGDLIPQSGEIGYVEQLQKDLEELGFQLFPKGYKYGTFDEKTDWAVREFQIYAQMAKISKQIREPNYEQEQGDRYADCLKEQSNSTPYRGAITGIVNQKTRELIELWKNNDWRCPVVVEAWHPQKDKEKPFNLRQALPEKNQNIWLPTAVTQEARMFVRDFTGYYSVPSERFDFSRYYDLSKENPVSIEKLKQLIVIGTYSKAMKGGPVTYGAYHVWEPETEIRPENFIDSRKNYQTLNEAERSTYRVVRSVAEIECEGFFDVINAYDDAYISLGPCHWSLGKKELGGFLAYFENKFQNQFQRLIEFFGAHPSQSWQQAQGESTTTGRPVFNPDQRLYNSAVSLQTENRQDKNSNDPKYANYFKTWHWVYRFAMAGREEERDKVTDFRRSMWEFAVMRIRDILSAPIPKEWGVPNVSEGGRTRPAQIGDIYTSEKAVALLLRWHVYRPSQVIIRGQASQLEEKLLFSVPGTAGEINQLEDELNQGKVTTNWQQKLSNASIQGVKKDDPIAKKTLVNITTNESISLWRIKATTIVNNKKNESFYRIRREDSQFNVYSLPTPLDGCLRDAYQRAGSPRDSSNQAILIKGLMDEMSQVKDELQKTAVRVSEWPNWSRGIKDRSRFYRLGENESFSVDDPDSKLEKGLPQKSGAISKTLPSNWRKQFSNRGIFLSQDLEIINRTQQTWSIRDKANSKEFVIRRQNQQLIIYQIVIERNKGLSEVDKSFQFSQAASTDPVDLPLPTPSKPYSGYKLQFEDFDRQGTERFRYEKRLRTAERGEPVPADGNPGYVQELQQDLIKLGFLFVPVATGVFDRFTSYAVREFQIQAKMSKVAQENITAPPGTPYVNRLSASNNTHPYLGDVTGVVNEATGKLIKRWLQNNWRCPVVIQAWTMNAGVRDRPVDGKENLWGLRDLTDETVQVFVKDFSGYYQAGIPPAHRTDDWIELGQFFQTGPRSLNQLPENRHCWKESEVFPLNLLGKSSTDLLPVERALFSVFRAIGEAITGKGSCGFFDSIRTQPQHLPFFWLFGLRTDPAGFVNQLQEDVAAYLAYLRFAEPDSFRTAFGFFGLNPDRNWENNQGVGDGSSLLNVSQRRYVAGISLSTEAQEEELVEVEPEAFEYLSSWHWFYRWMMAARTVTEFQQGLWDYSRLQLQSILSTPWRDTTLQVNQRRAVLKEVYTSEQAIALIYYWYLRFPEDIVSNNNVAESLTAAFQSAGVSSNNPVEWEDVDEKKLIDALVAEAKARRTEDNFVRGIDYIGKWTQKREAEATQRAYQLYNDNFGKSLALNPKRNSFIFDNSQIPPPSNQIAQKRMIRLSGIPNSSTFGVLALEEQDSAVDSETYRVTAIVLTLASEGEPSETGLRIPLSQPVALNLKLNEEPLPNQDLQVLDPSQGTSQAIPIYEIATDTVLPSEETKWPLSLENLQDDNSALQCAASVVWTLARPSADLQRKAHLDIQFDANFIDNSPTWRFAAADSPFDSTPEPNTAQITSFIKLEDGLTFTLTSLQQALIYALPLKLPPIPGEVSVQFIENQIRLKLQIQQAFSLNLGSSLAQLKFNLAQLTLDSLEGLSLAIPPEATTQGISLDLDIFSRAIADQKVINNLWSNIEQFTDDAGEVLNLLIRIKSETISQLSQIEQLIVWRDRYPTIHKALFEIFDKTFINNKRHLTSFAGNVLGKLSPYEVFFQNSNETIKPKLISEQGRWKLVIPLSIEAREKNSPTSFIFKAKGEFGFWAEADSTDPDTYINVKSGAFAAEEKISLEVLEDKVSSFSDLISLYIPAGSIFIFSTDPRQPSITWEPNPVDRKTNARIAIRIPATQQSDLKTSEKGRFTFEMGKFSIGTAGFDFKGAVRVENVFLGEANETGFKEPLAIKSVERKGNENEQKELKIGEIEFRQSKLVGGSLQAVAKLIYFDDAIATFSLAVSQEEITNTLSVVGTLDITGLSEFHKDELFSTFEISLLHLETTYEQRNGSRSWGSRGTMTGRIKFLPAKGRSASEMGALASLFEGVTVEFEDLNPVEMEAEELKITFPAKKFEFASIFIVDLRGIVINPRKAAGFGLLGDINIQRLPGVDSQFTFGGITLTPLFEDSKAKAPKFSISRIGAGLSVQGGFEIQGLLDWIKNEQEVGFGGTVTLKSEAFGKLDGLIKVTRLKTPEGYVPSLAVYFQKDIDVALFAGFFLRNIGVGLGINQALNGLDRKDLPLPQRIISLVNSPNGLPDPELLESWVPNPPATSQINWMLVAAGLITLGKLPPNVEHPLAGRIILAIDQDLDIVAGVNIWLFCSPNQTQQRQFIERPVARGAIAISPREQQVFGLFRTVKNPQLTPKAPSLLKEVLNKVDTSLMFVGDRNGFLLEVGWPWETKINYSIGILRGILTSGFRFGIYRGVTSFGLNFAINIILNLQLRIELSLGPLSLGAFLSISGKGYFRCSFIGALTPNFTPYLLGNVQLATTVSIKGSLCVKFSKKVCGVRIRKTLLDISCNINITLSAVFTAALDEAQVSFQGSARVAVGKAGYSFDGNVPIEYKPDRIKSTEEQLNKLLPRRVNAQAFALMQPLKSLEIETEEAEPVWNYQVCRVKDQIRILILPKPGQNYPAVFYSPNPELKKSRFQIKIKVPAERFKGFLGSSSNPKINPDPEPGILLQDNQLNWRENFYEEYRSNQERIILTREEILKNGELDESTDNWVDLIDLTLERFLIALTSNNTNDEQTSANKTERIDRRTQNPLAAQTDDETTAIATKGLASPYFKGEFEDQQDSYDNQLAEACQPDQDESSQNREEEDDSSGGLSLGQIVAELTTLIKDPEVDVNVNATRYTVAPYLNLILVFKEEREEENNQVEQLLDLASFQVWNEEAQFQTVKLEPLVDQTEYDLLPGSSTFQSQTEICLSWTFKREDEDLSDRTHPGNPEYQRISEAYKSVDRFVVTRTILNRPNQQLVQEVNPCWIKVNKNSSQSLLLRPQFQFVDNRLQDSGIQENDLLQYRVEAKTLGGETLAQCLINVVRQTIKPLKAPTQSLALHKLKRALKVADQDYRYQQNKIEIRVAFWFDLLEDSNEIEKKKQEIVKQLQVCYRSIPASKVGFYGVEANLGIKSQWAEQRIAQKEIEIQFAQSEQNQSIPWEEVQRLSVQFKVVLQEKSEDNQQLQVIYQAIIPEPTFWGVVRTQRGMAVELFVGCEIPADRGTKEPLKRSPLIRCRHAIQLPIFDAQQDSPPKKQDSPLKDFETGNTVSAIEKLPDQLPSLSYQDPRLIKGWANYPAPDTAIPVKLAIEWQHLRKKAVEYNPIAAYRLYRADAYSATGYVRLDDEQRLRVQPELTFRVIPQAIYQANPSTIEVLGRKDRQSQKVLTDWQAQGFQQRLWEDTNPATGTFTLLSSGSDPSYPASPIWVLETMANFIKKMQLVLGDQQYRPVLKFHHPLEDRSPLALENEGATPRERLDRLIGNLDETIDPLGWWTLETLGLSCECHFEDEGKRVDAHWLIKKLRESLEGEAQAYPFSVVLFLAEDGKTFLNVLRLIYTEETWNVWTAPPSSPVLALPLGLRLKGRPDHGNENEVILKPEEFDDSGRSALETWLNQIKDRATASMPDKLLIPGRVIVYRYVGLGNETSEQKQLTQVTLPITSDGLIRYELPVPDQWAHQYAIALEHLRRYDLVWQRLIAPAEQSAFNIREIPYNQLLHVRVGRTLRLVPHNIIAFPCFGGIQSLVFVHPAAFAALASAVNAAHGQYSGQHVFLERRINPEEKTKMLDLYKELLSIQQWELYRAWMEQLEPLELPNPDTSPSLLEKTSVSLTEVSGTLAAIYGSDRYIYPDLPGYYEYRVAVYSSAGRVCSPVQVTPFISPLYDQPTLRKDQRKLQDEPRQQPQTFPCKEVSFNGDNNTLLLKIRLIHYRNHLRDVVREVERDGTQERERENIKSLWRNSEDNLNVGTDTQPLEIDYGSLPDLYLTYQVYLRENPGEENFADPVLLPLVEVVPPLQRGNDPKSKFERKIQLTGVQPIGEITIEQASDGELYFQIELDFNNPDCREALKKLRDYNPIEELIYLSVAREGVWSEIVTTTTAV